MSGPKYQFEIPAGTACLIKNRVAQGEKDDGFKQYETGSAVMGTEVHQTGKSAMFEVEHSGMTYTVCISKKKLRTMGWEDSDQRAPSESEEQKSLVDNEPPPF